jgi:head-tail adaptor
MTAQPATWPDAGELIRRVIIRKWTSEANIDMGIDETFDAGVKRWAKLEPASGAAYWGSKQVDEGMTHRLWIRYGTGSTETDITGQHVVDYPQGNQRFRVLRSTNVGDAQRFTMLEVKLLGAIV